MLILRYKHFLILSPHYTRTAIFCCINRIILLDYIQNLEIIYLH